MSVFEVTVVVLALIEAGLSIALVFIKHEVDELKRENEQNYAMLIRLRGDYEQHKFNSMQAINTLSQYKMDKPRTN